METPASIAKHPLHPILVAVPIGLWLFSLVCDLIYLWIGDDAWSVVAFYTMGGGLVGALLAGAAGVADFAAIPPGHVRRIALWHMGLNIAIVTAFAINFALRWIDPAAPPGLAVGLSTIAVLALAVSGWLGGEMVHVHGVSVANTPAPGIAGPGLERRAAPRSGAFR